MINDLAQFTLLCLSALYIGKWFKNIGLPLISGFLFAGIISGPFFLTQLTHEEVIRLGFIDDIALGFIALSAGAELYLNEFKERIKSILYILACLVIFTITIGTIGIFLISDWIPFTHGLSPLKVLAISLLMGTILMARSPSAAIAIINELKAKGPFTQTVLSVTVLMDVVVITLFAINLSIADAFMNERPINLSFLLMLALKIFTSLIVGGLLATVIRGMTGLKLRDEIKAIMILGAGYSVFLGAEYLTHWSLEHFGSHFTLEPLLICMVAGTLMTNVSGRTLEFSQLIHRLSPYVYVAFFTLTGATLKVDILMTLWPIALAIFMIRLVGIFIGSFVGGVLAHEPKRHNYIRWMGFVTQAGVGLGLAKGVESQFPS